MKTKFSTFVQNLFLSKTLLFFSIFSLLPGLAAAQWVAQNSGTFNHVLGIHFVDNNTGYAVGGGGVILKTIDGGVNWNAQASGTGNDFYATCFTSASNGVAVGNNSTIVRTTDGGSTWASIPSSVFVEFRAVWFLNANVGFITGGLPFTPGVILKTTDGGATWSDISPGNFTAIYSVFFTDANTGYACDYDGYILKTIDGGSTWASTFVSNNHLFGIHFTDANHGYCVGGDWNINTTVILKTNDAGTTWTATNNPDPSANYFTDVEFTDANTGYAIGGNVQNNTGNILKTTNAGLTWTTESTTPSTTSRLYRLSLPSASTGYACGLDGTILKIAQPTPPQDDPCDVKIINCVKYELLTITEDAGDNRTYRIRVTNNCANKLAYFAVQVPDGLQAMEPADNTVVTSEGGRQYKVRSPNFSPFYSVRFKPTTDSIANGQSDVFEYKLPAQAADPTFIHVTVRLATQVYHESHLNTFYCPIGQTPNVLKPKIEDMAAVQKASIPSLTVFPNPATGDINIEWSSADLKSGSVQIVNNLGQALRIFPVQEDANRLTTNIAELPRGIYFVKILSDGRQIKAMKFVKQ